MRFKIAVANYRCFPTFPRTEFEIGAGVTAFVGENNAGKSAAMRLLHDLRPLFETVQIPSGLNRLLKTPVGGLLGREVRDPDEIVFNGTSGPLELSIQMTQQHEVGVSPLEAPVPNQLTLTQTSEGWKATWPGTRDLLIDDSFTFYCGGSPGLRLGDAKPIMSALAAMAKAVYIPSTRHVLRGDTDSFDAAVGDRLVTLWDQINSGLAKRDNTLAESIERSLTSLFGPASVRAIPTLGVNNGMQFKITGAGQFRSDEVGAGLSQAFAALFVVATKRPSLVLIDEPELSLNAKLQFRFLTELQRYASLGLVMSTHNLGLAMNAAEDVYLVTRQSGNRSTQGRPWSKVARFCEATEVPALLGALSYPSYGDPATRHVLLVEGPTDLRVVHLLLQQLGIADRVVAVHMGGNTTINSLRNAKDQLSGVKRLCSRVWCLIDSEATKDGEIHRSRMAFLEACRSMDIEAHATRRRATENYLSDAACKRQIGPDARGLAPFEKLGDAQPGWTKQQSWIIALAMDLGEFEDVGDFLKRLARAVEHGSSAS